MLAVVPLGFPLESATGAINRFSHLEHSSISQAITTTSMQFAYVWLMNWEMNIDNVSSHLASK